MTSDIDAIAMIGKACVLYAEAIAYITTWHEPSVKHIDAATRLVFESTYFISIYLIRSIITLHCRSASWESETAQINGLLLATFTRWFNSFAAGLINFMSMSSLYESNFEVVQQVKLVLSPFLACVKLTLHPFFFHH